MYRILFIESGDYLYYYSTMAYGDLYSKAETTFPHNSGCAFHIYEVKTKQEAINKLSDSSLFIYLSEEDKLVISANLTLFEIVEVKDV